MSVQTVNQTQSFLSWPQHLSWVIYLALIVALIFFIGFIMRSFRPNLLRQNLNVRTNTSLTPTMRAVSFCWKDNEYLVLQSQHSIVLIDKVKATTQNLEEKK